MNEDGNIGFDTQTALLILKVTVFVISYNYSIL